MVKLIDVCDIQYGYAFDSGCFTDDDSYPQLVRIRDVKRGFSETYYNGEYPEEYILTAGDLLIGMDGEFNIARWKTDGALLNQRVCKVVAKPNSDEEYLRFMLGKVLKDIEHKTSFATVKHLSAKVLNALELDIPKYNIQKHRASVLTKLESIIVNRRNELNKLDELIKSRFVEMFGDVIINDKKWNTKTWNEVLTVINGKNQQSVENEKGQYLICGSGGPMSRADDYLVKENSVIIGRKGNINNPILMREKYWNVDTAFGLEPKIKIINVDYLYMFCLFFDFNQLNKAVTIPSLTKRDILKIVIPTPDIKLQNEFSFFVRQIDKLKFIKYRSIL